MRLSFDPDDRAYSELLSLGGYRFKVYLDGEEQPDACTADDEAGEVVRAKRNADGEIYLLPDDKVALETVTGSVRIEPLDGLTYDVLHGVDPERFP